ncbi:MAG: hypothetical protein HY718_07925, partial [Planctomycetes bacterium]|nr:hypothetical protein [Planctomycetota bacterium]
TDAAGLPVVGPLSGFDPPFPSPLHTDVNGRLNRDIQLPITCGLYLLKVEVTDTSFYGLCELPLTVPCADCADFGFVTSDIQLFNTAGDPISTVLAGDVVNVKSTVYNTGTLPTVPNTVRLFVDGLLRGSIAIPALPPTGRAPVSLPWTVPQTKTFLLRLVVDEFNLQSECDESNNATERLVFPPPTLLPNLTPLVGNAPYLRLALPGTGTPSPLGLPEEPPLDGAATTIWVTVRNTGTAPSIPSNVVLLVDGNPVGATVTVPPIPVNGNSGPLALAWTALSGQTTVGARVDPANALVELSEADNDAVRPLPDLACGAFHITSLVNCAGDVTLEVKQLAQPDHVIPVAPYFVQATIAPPALPVVFGPFTAVGAVKLFNGFSFAAGGTFNIGAVIDPSPSQVPEPISANNSRTQSFDLRPDLSPWHDPAGPNSFVPPGLHDPIPDIEFPSGPLRHATPTDVSLLIFNRGRGCAENVNVQLGFHRAGAPTAKPNQTIVLPVLDPGSTRVTFVVVANGDATATDYFDELIVTVDPPAPPGAIVETDETNNVTGRIVKPDVTPVSTITPVSPAFPQNGVGNTLQLQVANRGEYPVFNLPTQLRDDLGALWSAPTTTGPINPGATIPSAVFTWTPDTNNPAPHPRELKGILDPLNIFMESNEANNEVACATADVVATDVQLRNVVADPSTGGCTADLLLTIANAGCLPVGPIAYTVRVSRLAVVILPDTNFVGAVGSNFVPITLTSAGPYVIDVAVDRTLAGGAPNTYPEGDEGNNVKAFTLDVQTDLTPWKSPAGPNTLVDPVNNHIIPDLLQLEPFRNDRATRIHARIKNQGLFCAHDVTLQLQAFAGAAVFRTLTTFRLEGSAAVIASLPALNPGETVNLLFDYPPDGYPITQPLTRIEVSVDPPAATGGA